MRLFKLEYFFFREYWGRHWFLVLIHAQQFELVVQVYGQRISFRLQIYIVKKLLVKWYMLSNIYPIESFNFRYFRNDSYSSFSATDIKQVFPCQRNSFISESLKVTVSYLRSIIVRFGIVGEKKAMRRRQVYHQVENLWCTCPYITPLFLQ